MIIIYVHMFFVRSVTRLGGRRCFSSSGRKDGFRGVIKRLDGRWDAEIKLEDGETYHIGK